MEPYQNEAREQNLFDEDLYHLVQASGGKRFLNYLIDRVVFIIFSIVADYLFTIFQSNLTTDNTVGWIIASFLFDTFLYVGFMGFMEFVLKGKTIGKFCTRTRAVMQDGSEFTLSKALLRALCRIIPFNEFSAFGNPSYPWHDRFSKTYVIDELKSRIYIE